MNIENTKLREKVNKLEATVEKLSKDVTRLRKIEFRFEGAKRHYMAFRRNFDVERN